MMEFFSLLNLKKNIHRGLVCLFLDDKQVHLRNNLTGPTQNKPLLFLKNGPKKTPQLKKNTSPKRSLKRTGKNKAFHSNPILCGGLCCSVSEDDNT